MARTKKGSHLGGSDAKKHHLEQEQPERESFLKSLPPTWGKNQGYNARMSPYSGWCIVELDCWADPRKDTKWARKMLATIGPQRFAREFQRNWSLSTQSPFYPEYTLRGGDDHFQRKITSLGKGPIALGLDFGFRRPAVVATQANPERTRAYILREWMPQNVSAFAFMQVVEWLVGELDERELGPEALKHVLDLRRAAERGDGPPVPWFYRPGQIVRYTSHEALRVSQEVADDNEGRRIVDIWEKNGFPLQVHTQPVRQGELVIRHLFRTVESGRLPWMVIDPWCKILCQGFSGGYTYKRPTKLNPAPDEPAKDGYFEHPQDALRYVLSQIIDIKATAIETTEQASELLRKLGDRASARPRLDKGAYSRDHVEQEDWSYSSQWDPQQQGGWSNDKDVYNREEN